MAPHRKARYGVSFANSKSHLSTSNLLLLMLYVILCHIAPSYKIWQHVHVLSLYKDILSWAKANSIFDLENSRSRSCPRSNSMITFEAASSIDMFAFCVMAIRPFLAEILQIPYLTLKIQGHGQGQTRWSHLRPRVQSICLLFISWQSNHFCLRYSKFHIWPWKFKVKVTTKIDQNLIR